MIARIKFRRRKVRYAVIGAGHIAQAAVLPAFAHAGRNSELVALVSGDEKKRRELSRRYRLRKAYPYEAYEECLRNGEVDAVYIALPNDMHREYAVRAARAGVHVLCEKPLALDEDECRHMIETAEAAGVKLMTAYRLHFERANLEAVEVVRSGQIGEARFFSSTFSFPVKDEKNIRLSAARGGGPLYDIGVYCINAARYLFRDEPTEVLGFAENGGERRFREVDEATAAVLRFPDARLATFVSSFGAADTDEFRIVGTEGVLCVERSFEYTEGITHRLTVGGKTKTRTFPKRDQFAPELLYFSDCILAGKEPEPSGAEGLADVRVIRAIDESIRTGRSVFLPAFHRRKRPSMRQEIARPPVRERPQVKVRPASE